jgi:hypothetical protein
LDADVVYIAASARDARFTRTCVASVRTFYPDIAVRLLPGGRLSSRLVRELRQYWNVEIHPIPPGDYGWGFVKLEPLFGPAGERFLVLDSDTVVTGPVLDLWDAGDAPFLVDDEQQSDAETKRLYYDWEKVRRIDVSARPPAFVFNSGQWFGTAGVLTREDFAPLLEWSMPRKVASPECFKQGEQGLLNYVLNQKALLNSSLVARHPIMRWPGHGMQGLTADALRSGTAPALVVHWAGQKRTRQRDMTGADVLAYFERLYYARLPAGAARRPLAGSRHVVAEVWHGLSVRASLAIRRARGGHGRTA